MAIRPGWLDGAAHCPSPNFDARPAGTAIDLLVIHNISLPPGEFGGQQVRDLFCNRLDCTAHPYFARLRELRVSAHLLLERSGVMVQFVSLADRAWHAGQSSFLGRDDCNDFSIGIELEGTDHQAYTDLQYAALVTVTARLRAVCPGISPARIVGHADIAPGRKSDPGPAFDWQRYRNSMNGE